jgi:hypothetical protein
LRPAAFLLVVCWYDTVAFPTVSRVNSVVSGYVLLHLWSISDFTVKVKRLIRYDNLRCEWCVSRVTVNKALDLLLTYRPDREQFPIIVSQDCAHQVSSPPHS